MNTISGGTYKPNNSKYLLAPTCDRYHSKHFTYINSLNPHKKLYEGTVIIMPLFQTRESRSRKIK